MNDRTLGRWTIGALVLLAAVGRLASAQVVINEIVKDVRNENAGDITDDREFIELYNAGNAPVDIGGWTLNYWDMSPADPPGSSYTAFVDTIPPGTILPAGGFYVIGSSNVPNVDLAIGTTALFLDLNSVFELRNGPRESGGVIQDAVALDIQRGREYAALAPEHAAFVGQGWWGQNISYNTVPGETNVSQSVGRYRDGVNTNNNGRDFGMLPLTPGASNNRPQAASYDVPNVDAIPVGTRDTSVYASFKLPYVIDPTVVGPAGLGGQNVNPKAIPASPQGGRALMAWDETGGGNAVYSYNYVNKFQLSAYIETAPLAAATATARIQSEATVYGLGTTDPLFTTPDATGFLGTTFSSNGSKGLGWYIQKIERFGDADFDDDLDVDGTDYLAWQRGLGTTTGATNGQGDADANGNVNAADLNYWRVQHGSTLAAYPAGVTRTVLMLVDMGDGGDSWPADQEWKIIQAFDLTNAPSGWHTLGIDYNPTTGAVVATYDNQTFNFTTDAGWVGNFYVGYREGLPGNGGPTARPPTYDLVAMAAAASVPEPASAGIAGAAALALLTGRKKRRSPQIA